MKKLVTILFLSLFVSAFGQSKKKINEQLKLELAQKVKTYDSLAWVLGKKNEQIQLQGASLPKMLEYIKVKGSEEKRYRDEIAKYQKLILERGGNPETIVSTGKLDSLKAPACQFDTAKYERVVHAKLFPASVDKLEDLSNLSQEEQNILLKRKVVEYDSAIAINRKQFEAGLKFNREWGDVKGELTTCTENIQGYINTISGFQAPLSFGYSRLLLEKDLEYVLKNSKSTSDKIETTPNPEKAPEIMEDILPEGGEFPGGQVALMEYLKKNMILPKQVANGTVSGRVYMRFLILEDGSISKISLQRGLLGCIECEEEAKRLIETMPKWTPAMLEGKPVQIWYNLPIKFQPQ